MAVASGRLVLGVERRQFWRRRRLAEAKGNVGSHVARDSLEQAERIVIATVIGLKRN